MSLLDDVPVQAVLGLDTSLFIYWFEAHSLYQPVLVPLFESRLEAGLNEAITSTVTLAEVLVQPLAQGRGDLASAYRGFLQTAKFLALVPITDSVSERAASLRVRHGIRLPDAFQIAAALEWGAACFLTNDAGLQKVSEIDVLVLRNYLPPTAP